MSFEILLNLKSHTFIWLSRSKVKDTKCHKKIFNQYSQDLLVDHPPRAPTMSLLYQWHPMWRMRSVGHFFQTKWESTESSVHSLDTNFTVCNFFISTFRSVHSLSTFRTACLDLPSSMVYADMKCKGNSLLLNSNVMHTMLGSFFLWYEYEQWLTYRVLLMSTVRIAHEHI